VKGIKWCLAVLSLGLTACPVLSLHYAPHIRVEYKANGVCNGVEVTNNRNSNQDTNWGLGYIAARENGRTDSVLLPTGQAVRIPEPNQLPHSTWYFISGGGLLTPGTKLEVDLLWRCLPDKQSERIQFTHIHMSAGPSKGLTITEDASLPSGLRIEVTDFPLVSP
jgi:hypothetical protein